MDNALLGWTIDAHRGEGGTSCTPSKDFEKLYHKTATKHEIDDHLPDFLTTPSTNLKRI
jgi:hypothetical protein